MRLKVINNDFLKALETVSRVAIKNNINPVFECVFLKLDEHKLIVRATNLEVIIEKNINVKGEINGQVLLKVSTIIKILHNLDSGISLDIEKNGNSLSIKTDNDDFVFDIQSEEDLPNIPKEESLILDIKKETFSNLIKSVIFCAAKSDIKPEIASVYLYKKDNNLISVATDSYRLAEKTVTLDTDNIKNTSDINLILPQKNLINIIPVIDDIGSENILLHKYGEGLIISSKDTFIAMRVINGNFPDYRQLFPKEYIFSFELNKTEIIKTLQITNILTTQYNFCEFNLNTENKKIEIKAIEKSIGNVRKTLLYKDISGEMQDFSINYNSAYFLEGLQKMDGSSVILKYTTTNKPMFLESNNDLSFKYLLMPLNR